MLEGGEKTATLSSMIYNIVAYGLIPEGSTQPWSQ